MKKLRKQLLLLAAILVLTLTGCEAQDLLSTERADSGSEVTAAYTMTESQITDQAPTAVSVLDVPEFSGEPYVVLNGNEPDFTDEEKTTESLLQRSRTSITAIRTAWDGAAWQRRISARI